MVTTSYGNYSPQAIDPFPIESTLAPLAAGGSSARAQTMLDLYQLKNAVSEDNYNAQLEQQHQFAKDQLAQQLYEANLKGLAEAKDPQVLQLMAASPQFSSSVLGGIDKARLGDIITRARQGQDVGNYKNTMEGANAASQAGVNTPIPDLSYLSGMPGLTQGVPRSIQEAYINANARMAAAAMAANQANLPGVTTQIGDPSGIMTTINGKLDPRLSSTQQIIQQQQVLAAIDAWEKGGRQGPMPDVSMFTTPKRVPLTGLGAAGPGNKPRQGAQQPPLPPAPTEGAGGTGPGVATPPAPQPPPAAPTGAARPAAPAPSPAMDFAPIQTPDAQFKGLNDIVDARVTALKNAKDPLYDRLKLSSGSTYPLFRGKNGQVYVRSNDGQQYFPVQ